MDEAVNPAEWGAQPVGAAAESPADWGAQPAAAEQEPKRSLPQAALNLGKRFWETFTEGGIEKFVSEMLPGQLVARREDVRQAEQEFKSNDEWAKERARRQQAGESLSGMENWKLDRINQIVAKNKGAVWEPPLGTPAEVWENLSSEVPQLARGIVRAAADDPGGFAGKVMRGLIAHPELLMTPQALPARMAEVAGRIGEIGTEAAQIGGAIAGESALGQLVEIGKVEPAKTVTETGVTLGGMMALRLAADYMLARSAKAKNIEPSQELTRTVIADTEARAQAGQSLDSALKAALEAVKVDPELAAEAAAMIKDHLPAEAPKTETKLEAKTEAPVATETLLLKPEEHIAPAEEPPPVPAKVLEPSEITQADLFANQSGKADPKLLAALGIAGIGGAAAYLYDHDPKDAVIGALATGGVLAAGALLKRGARGIGEVMDYLRDTRYKSPLFEQRLGNIGAAQLANLRFSEYLKALVPDKMQREQLTHYIQGDTSISVTPEMQKAADAVKSYFETMGEKGQQAGVLPDELLDNYVTQLWTGLNKDDSLFRNLMTSLGMKNQNVPGMSTRSRFAMERTIPSYKEGMAKGMIPSTLDIADIVRIYGDNIAKVIENKNLIQALQRERTPWGEALLIRDTPAAIAKDMGVERAKLEQALPGGGEIGKDIRDFALRNSLKEYKYINHPQLRGYKVHPDIEPQMRHFFDAAPNEVVNAFNALSVAAKRMVFSYSLFHATSLATAAAGTGIKSLQNILSGKAWQQFLRGGAGDVVEQLVKGGLQITHRPIEGEVTPFTNALKLIEERHPVIGLPAKVGRMAQQANDHLLWEREFPLFKVGTGMAAMETLLQKAKTPGRFDRLLDTMLGKRDPNLTPAAAAKYAAQFTNSMYGGLDWFRIADAVENKLGRTLALAVTSPRGRQFLQIMLKAPDWTVSTALSFYRAIPGLTPRELAGLHQAYVVRSLLTYATIANGLNLAFSGHNFWENKDPTMVDLGDGRKLQLSKHAMEPIHWLLDPWQQALNKLGFVPSEMLNQAYNMEYPSTKGAPSITVAGESMPSAILHRIAHAGKSMLPISGQVAMGQGLGTALSGFFGVPVYGKTEEQAVESARERAVRGGRDVGAAEQRVRRQRQAQREKEEAARR